MLDKLETPKGKSEIDNETYKKRQGPMTSEGPPPFEQYEKSQTHQSYQQQDFNPSSLFIKHTFFPPSTTVPQCCGKS